MFPYLLNTAVLMFTVSPSMAASVHCTYLASVNHTVMKLLNVTVNVKHLKSGSLNVKLGPINLSLHYAPRTCMYDPAIKANTAHNRLCCYIIWLYCSCLFWLGWPVIRQNMHNTKLRLLKRYI